MVIQFNNSLLNDMESFDLLCINYKNCGSMISRIFQNMYIGDGEWGHVGIIIKNDVIPDIKNKIYIWHSCIRSNGVQLYELEKYCKLDKLNITKIGWCKLKNNPLHRNINDTDKSYNKRIAKIKKNINNIYIHSKKSKFNYFMPKLVFPFLQNISPKPYPHLNNLNIKKSYFCSEFITTIYKRVNVVDENVDPESIFPATLIKYENKNGPIFNKPILLNLI